MISLKFSFLLCSCLTSLGNVLFEKNLSPQGYDIITHDNVIKRALQSIASHDSGMSVSQVSVCKSAYSNIKYAQQIKKLDIQKNYQHCLEEVNSKLNSVLTVILTHNVFVWVSKISMPNLFVKNL